MKPLADLIKDVSFKEFDGYDLSKILAIASVNQQLIYDASLIGILRYIKIVFDKLSYDEYKMELDSSLNSHLLFIYSYQYYREDHFRTFKNLVNIIDNKDVYAPVHLEKKRNFKRFLSLLPMYIRWMIKMVKKKFPFQYILLTVENLGVCYNFLQEAEKQLTVDKYKCCITYYDVCPTENVLMQYIKGKRIITATLQHGIFNAPLKVQTKRQMTGLELVNSVSDYYLAWNNYTKDQLLQSGIEENRIKVLGILKYVNISEQETWSTTSKRIIGVVLGSHGDCGDQNIALITAANYISEKMGYKYIVKYHPGSNGNEYDHIIERKYLLKIAPKYQEIKAFCEETQFSIVGNSSVYIDMVFGNYPVYRHRTEFDQYYMIQENSFSSPEELFDMLKDGIKASKTCFDYLCTVENIKDSYLSFFERVGMSEND